MENQTAEERRHRITLLTPDGARTIMVPSGECIWDAARNAGIDLPAMCHQGRCLTCAGRIEGPGDYDQSDSDTYFEADRKAGFMLLCTAKALSDLSVCTHQENEMRRHRLALNLPAPYA